MVSVDSVASAGEQTPAVLKDLDAQIRQHGADAAFVYAFYGCDHDDQAIYAFLRNRFPDAAILGGTSCSGVMNQDKLWGELDRLAAHRRRRRRLRRRRRRARRRCGGDRRSRAA